jgi:hypothetical protein
MSVYKRGRSNAYSGYTKLMLMAIAITIAASIKITFMLDGGRKLPPAYESIDLEIKQAGLDVAELSALPELPSVVTSWGKLENSSQTYGFQIRPYGETDVADSGLYVGPLKSWSGIAFGPTALMLAAAKEIQKQIPVFLYEYRIEGEQLFINFSIVGT